MTASGQQPSSTDQPRARIGPNWPVLGWPIGILGLALVVAGVYTIMLLPGKGDTSLATLVGVGALLVVFACVGNRVSTLKFGSAELQLRREADDAESRGDIDTARSLKQAADVIGNRASRTANTYSAVRSSIPAGQARTEAMERLLAEAEADAFAPGIEQEDVLRRLWTGSSGARIWAIGILRRRPDFLTTRVILEAVQRPDEMFDQYYALVLAKNYMSLTTTGTWAKERIEKLVNGMLDSHEFGTDPDCLRVAHDIVTFRSSGSVADAAGAAGQQGQP